MYSIFLVLIVIATAFVLIRKAYVLSAHVELSHTNVMNENCQNSEVGTDKNTTQVGCKLETPEGLIFGTSRKGFELISKIRQGAKGSNNILIYGESGTCKSEIASYLHKSSTRNGKPLTYVRCETIPSDFIESTLFGYKLGAFVGAVTSKIGKLEMASGGTVFLEGLFDLPLALQQKILTALKEQTVIPVGSSDLIKLDVRYIIAMDCRPTDVDWTALHGMEDLFFILVSPLRERVEDIPLLINELILCLDQEKNRSIRFTSDAMLSLCRHDWSGNERELTSLMKKMVILNPNSVIGMRDLPTRFVHPYVDDLDSEKDIQSIDFHEHTNQKYIDMLYSAEEFNLDEFSKDMELELIQKALKDSQEITEDAAKMLGIDKVTLEQKGSKKR